MSIDRTIEPDIQVSESVPVLLPVCRRAKNGVELHVIEAGGQEVLRLSLVYRAGTRFQPHPYVASAAVNLLAEGTRRYTAREISEKIDFYGSCLDVSVDRDYAVVSLACLSKFLPEMLELLGEMTVRPVFPETELETYKNKRKHQLMIDREKISFRARELFGEALFGKGHPYGSYFTPADYDVLKTSRIKTFFKTYYHAGNCFAVASGKISEADQALILDLLEQLPAGGKVEFPDLPPVRSVSKASEERPDALQSAIRVGKILFPRTHPDYTGMQVLMMVLGGYFGSRLMSNLREERGYTYGIMAAMVNLESSGYLAIAAEVAAEATEDAVRQIFNEIRRLREEPIGEDELVMVKHMITGEFMRILDGPFGIADVTIENIQNGTSNEYVSRYLQEVKAITPKRLKSLAVKYLKEEGFVTVVVGKS